MSNNSNAYKAGLFIVIAFALGVAVFVGIKGAGTFFASSRSVTAAFDLDENLGGLKIGDTVRVGGYDQGRVTAITFVQAKGTTPVTAPRYMVKFTLPEHYELHADTVVQVEQGLTGTSNLNITNLGSGPVWDSKTELDGRPSALAEIYNIAPDARGLLSEVRTKIGPAYAKYESVMARADTALATADQALANGRDILGDSKSDFRGTIANLNTTTTSLKDRLPATIDRVDKFLDTTTQTINGAKGTLEDIRVAAANTKDATAEARSLLARNRSKIDKMIESLRDTGTNLEATSTEVRRSPWRLLYTPSKDEITNLNVYDTARQFAEAAGQLNDAATTVRDAMKDPSTSQDHLDALMAGLNASFENYKKVEQVLWQSVK